MFAEFAKIFHQKALSEGFIRMPIQGEGDLSSIAEFDFQKSIGRDLCIMRLIDTERISVETFAAMRAEAFAASANRRARLDVARVFIVYVFAGGVLGADFQDIISNGEEFADQMVYDICWGVALSQKDGHIFHNKRQPTDIGGAWGVAEAALSSFMKGDRVDAANVGDLERLLAHNDPFRAKAVFPFVTYGIIALNAFLLVLIYLNGGPNDLQNLIDMGALEPGLVLREGQYYRMFTVMFLHAGVAHFLSNSLGLYIFGMRMERYLGHSVFLLIYLVSGLGGSAASLIFTEGVAVGASAAIYGLVGGALAFAWVSGKFIDGFSLYFLVIYSVLGISMGFLYARVDNAAHIGGFVTGFVLCWVYCVCTKLLKQSSGKYQQSNIQD